VIHDLACGTGAMGRWLAPLLPAPQHWVGHDWDAELLAIAAADLPGPAADGAPVVVETRRTDITRVDPDDLADASLITASALLDLMTGDELARLAGVCAAPGCPVLLTLSVAGRVDLAPADVLDSRVAAAFDAHQRRMTAAGRLLGPDAAGAAVSEFRRAGAEVVVRPSPGGSARPGRPGRRVARRLGRCRGEQEVELAAELEPYVERRLTQARAWHRSTSPSATPTSWCCRDDQDHSGYVGLVARRRRRRDACRRRVAPGCGPVPRRRPRGRRRGTGGSRGHRRRDHDLLCVAVDDRGAWPGR
jgi:hypothetical protein